MLSLISVAAEESCCQPYWRRTVTCEACCLTKQHVVASARGVLERAAVADRCEVVAGSFLEFVPSGADAYVLKNVINDWDDDDAITILRNCRAVMRAGGRLLLIEPVVGPPNRPDPATFTDLRMLVMNGGRARSWINSSSSLPRLDSISCAPARSPGR